MFKYELVVLVLVLGYSISLFVHCVKIRSFYPGLHISFSAANVSLPRYFSSQLLPRPDGIYSSILIWVQHSSFFLLSSSQLLPRPRQLRTQHWHPQHPLLAPGELHRVDAPHLRHAESDVRRRRWANKGMRGQTPERAVAVLYVAPHAGKGVP